MCKPLSEGGQRCAAHTKERLERKARNMREAADKVASRGKDGLPAFHKAREEWEEAAVEYASTPTGAAALKERLATAEQAGDSHTAAMLTTIVERGEGMRAANEQIRAALALGRFTEAGLPEADRADAVAADENGQPLSETDQRSWLALVDAVHGRAEDSTGWGTTLSAYHAALTKADATIAAAASTDDDLRTAGNALVQPFNDHPAFEPDRRHYYDDYDGDDNWAYRRAVQGREQVMLAQIRRLLRHPNAGPRAFGSVARFLPPSETLPLPNCPDEMMMGVDAKVAAHVDDDTWKALRARAERSVPTAVFVAQHAPDENAREDARVALAGARWDTVPTHQLAYVRRNLDAACGPHAAEVERSLVEWVRYFGDDDTKERVLTDADRGSLATVGTAAGGSSEPVSLHRRTPRRLRPGR